LKSNYLIKIFTNTILDILSFFSLRYFKILSKRRKVVLVHFASASIGRLLPDMEEFFSELPYLEKAKIFGYFDKAKANYLATSFIKSKIKILPNPIMVRVFSKVGQTNYQETNLHIYVNSQGQFFPFSMYSTTEVKKEFWQFLQEKSTQYPPMRSPSKPYVVLCVREPTNPEINDNLRNSSPSIFLPIVDFLAANDLNCIRMSRNAKFQMCPKSSYFVDYPFTDFKSDFADFALFKDAEFCISTGFGVDHFATFFGKPILLMNASLMATYLRQERRYILPKVFVDKFSKRILSIEEILTHNLHLIEKDNELDSRGITLMDNSPQIMIRALREFCAKGYFLSNNENTKSIGEAKRIGMSRFEYHTKSLSKRIMHEKNFNLEDLIYVSPYWPNITSANKKMV